MTLSQLKSALLEAFRSKGSMDTKKKCFAVSEGTRNSYLESKVSLLGVTCSEADKLSI